MYKLSKVKFFVMKEMWVSGDFWSALRHKIYSRAEAVPVKKDLSKLSPANTASDDMSLDLVEITADGLRNFNHDFAIKSRESRVALHIKKGYRGFGLVKEGQIVGDIWYVTNELANQNVVNPSIQLFRIKLADNDVYLFDMYLASNERGKVSTTTFLARVLTELKGRGYRNAFGFFYMGNLPALWVHRVLGYEEMPHYTIRKYLAWKIVKPVTNTRNQNLNS